MKNITLKKNKLLLMMVVVLSMAMALCACGSSSEEATEPSTLEQYMAENPDIQKQVEETISGMENSVVNAEVTYEKNTEIVKCTFIETYDNDEVETMKDMFEEQSSMLETTSEQIIEELSDATGLSGITIRFVYFNGDDTEIWSREYAGK